MSFLAVMFGHLVEKSALSGLYSAHFSGRSDSGKIAFVRAHGHARPAVDALVGVDGEQVGALVEAVDGAHLDAVGVLALDAPFSDDVGHSLFRSKGRVGILSLSPQVGLGRAEPLTTIQASRRLSWVSLNLCRG